jgi:uncharacterized membrane protein
MGIVVALSFVWWSLTPSLLPRGPMLQAGVSGVVGAVGYGLGSALGSSSDTRPDACPVLR